LDDWNRQFDDEVLALAINCDEPGERQNLQGALDSKRLLKKILEQQCDAIPTIVAGLDFWNLALLAAAAEIDLRNFLSDNELRAAVARLPGLSIADLDGLHLKRLRKLDARRLPSEARWLQATFGRGKAPKLDNATLKKFHTRKPHCKRRCADCLGVNVRLGSPAEKMRVAICEISIPRSTKWMTEFSISELHLNPQYPVVLYVIDEDSDRSMLCAAHLDHRGEHKPGSVFWSLPLTNRGCNTRPRWNCDGTLFSVEEFGKACSGFYSVSVYSMDPQSRKCAEIWRRCPVRDGALRKVLRNNKGSPWISAKQLLLPASCEQTPPHFLAVAFQSNQALLECSVREPELRLEWGAAIPIDESSFLAAEFCDFYDWRRPSPSLSLTSNGEYRGDHVMCQHEHMNLLYLKTNEDSVTVIAVPGLILDHALLEKNRVCILWREGVYCGLDPLPEPAVLVTTKASLDGRRGERSVCAFAHNNSAVALKKDDTADATYGYFEVNLAKSKISRASVRAWRSEPHMPLTLRNWEVLPENARIGAARNRALWLERLANSSRMLLTERAVYLHKGPPRLVSQLGITAVIPRQHSPAGGLPLIFVNDSSLQDSTGTLQVSNSVTSKNIRGYSAGAFLVERDLLFVPPLSQLLKHAGGGGGGGSQESSQLLPSRWSSRAPRPLCRCGENVPSESEACKLTQLIELAAQARHSSLDANGSGPARETTNARKKSRLN
jgi:hypothetical protein